MPRKQLKQCVAEFNGAFALIFLGASVVFNNTQRSWVGLLVVALAHGLSIAAMVSATMLISGGHWNHHIVCWAGPLLGGALAGLIYGRFLIKES